MRTAGSTSQVDPTAYRAKEIAQTDLISGPIEPLPSDLPYPSLATKGSDPDSLQIPSSPPSKSTAQKGGIFNAFRSGTKKDRDSRRRSLDPQNRAGSPVGGLERAQSRLSQDSSHNQSRPAGPRSMARAARSPHFVGRSSLDVPLEGQALPNRVSEGAA